MVTTTHYGDVSVLTIKGELTSETLDDFIEQRDQVIAGSHHRLVVDCQTLDGIDSTGLEALCALRQACEALGGTVRICALDAVGRKILEITRLDRRFELFDDLDSAVRSFV